MRPLGRQDPATIGPYRLVGVLGTGGMGRVYLGQSPAGRRLAIKVIRPDLADDAMFRARFAREVEAARSVSPLFTAAVVDADPGAPEPWLATTYIDGVSLERRVLDDGPLAIGEARVLAAGLAEALRAIHSVGLVHRDFKPSNILLNDTGPHIIDFGLALGATDVRMTTSLVVGTPSYMSPERLRGEDAGPASDIFSFGATMVFATTGHELVDDGSVYEQVLQIAEGRYRLDNVPRRLRPLVIRCVGFEPVGRPTADELLHILIAMDKTAAEDFFDGPTEQVLGPPIPPTRPDRVIHPREAPSISQPIHRDTPPGRRTTVGAPRIATGTTRRALIGTAVGVLGAAAIAGVAAAVAGAFRPDYSAGDGALDESSAPPSTPVSTSPSASLSAAAERPARAGEVLWRVAAAAPGRALATSPLVTSGVRVVIGPGDRVITATDTGLTAVAPAGTSGWQRPLPGPIIGLWSWGAHAMATDGTHAWLVDGATGAIRFDARPIDMASAALTAGGSAVAVDPWAAFSATDAFLGVGNACLALDPRGAPVWAVAGGDFQATSADAHHLIGRTPRLVWTNDVMVDARTGQVLWNVPPGGADRAGRIAAGQPVPPLGANADPANAAHEARLGPTWVAIRDGGMVRVRHRLTGRLLWTAPAGAPITAIEALDDSVLIASDLLRAYDATTGRQRWIRPLSDARLAASTTPDAVVVATQAEIAVLDRRGRPFWRTPMPSDLAGVPLERVIVANRRVYVTFAGSGTPAVAGTPGPDVLALALTDEG